MAYEILEQKSYTFALRVVKMHKELRAKRMNYGIGDQVLKSATSVGANISEAIFSQSVPDNIAKFAISLKEANETRYWLRLLTDAEYLSKEKGEQLISECTELIKMLVAVSKTLKSRIEQ